VPPVSNLLLYVYRVLMKWLAFFVFGLACVCLALLIFPPALIILHPREKFQKWIRPFIHNFMDGYVRFMHVIGIVDLEVSEEDRKALRQLSSKIIVANHPSLLDVVMIFSLIPNADCIVQGSISRTIMRTIVRQMYILNNRSFQDLINDCIASLDQGNCLIIFPEGTRTPRAGNPVVKKGAARIALLMDCEIIPLRIGGTDKYGLGKKDPWAGFNHTERYAYRIHMGAPLSPKEYAEFPLPRALRLLNGEIRAAIFNEPG
jgi:1-acyl-sn-glycerol-3-phosphate acyltransferase